MPQFTFHEAELLPLGDCASSLGCPPSQLTRLINKGRFPPPIQVEGKDPHSRSCVPKDECRYIAALMTAGRSWEFIESEVARMVRARSRISHFVPEALAEAGAIK